MSDNERRIDIIPSRDEREYLKSIGYQIEDRQYAALISSTYIPLFFPHPFEKGDIVKTIHGMEMGVVESSQEEWERLSELYKKSLEDGIELDMFMEDTIKVDFLESDGRFDHDHVSPIYLERVDMDSLPDSLDKTVLKFASGLIRGDGGLESFLHYYEMRRALNRTES